MTATRDYTKIRSVLATDCGSTTTKAILIEYDDALGRFKLVTRGEAPTTVEAPFEDVTRGVLNSVFEVEELRGRKFLDGENIIRPQQGGDGVDIYISTSSAGGGLQMMVAGVVDRMTTASATRAALSAGAIVMDAMSINDRRPSHVKIERIRHLRPDMLLISGGTDGGTVKHVVELAELISAANPRPRLGSTFDLPIIFAGNRKARRAVKDILDKKCHLLTVDNVRPVLEIENIGPARDKIHDLFMEHVMAQAPGYKKLMSWTDAPIMPTPGAVGLIIETIAKQRGITVVGVDIGGATTDVFSVFEDVFNRTVSANLGMSYSVCNVLAEAGLDNIMRWVPFDLDPAELRDRIGNKMIRPTTIPQTLEELKIEHAISREALRLAFIQHREFAVTLAGVQQERTISDAFDQTGTGRSLVNMMKLDLLVGSGGVLSHAPRRGQAMMMMIDAFLPEGVTELAVDSIFMMPHLGVLATLNEQAATEVFDNDCLVRLGTCIAPVLVKGKPKPGEPLAMATLHLPGGPQKVTLSYGELKLIKCASPDPFRIVIEPAHNYDVGAGPGLVVDKQINGGIVGVAFDGRGRRPFALPTDDATRVKQLADWNRAFDLYAA